MCKMTFVNDLTGIITPDIVRRITSTNAIFENEDGFGYFLFDINFLSKSHLEGRDFWRNSYQEYVSKHTVNGLYHARKASTIYNARPESSEDSHPFEVGNIVLTHNGTLNPRYTHKYYDVYRDILGNVAHTDSRRVAEIINKFSEETPLTQEDGIDVLQRATNMFSGAFCFFVHDKRVPNLCWVIRGKDRTLFKLDFEIKGIPGTVINTENRALLLLLEDIVYKVDGKRNNVHMKEFKEIPPNTTLCIDLNNNACEVYDNIIVQDSAFPREEVKVIPAHTTSVNKVDSTSQSLSILEKVVYTAFELGLSYTELCVIFEMSCASNIFCADDKDLESLFDVLLKFKSSMSSHKLGIWRSIVTINSKLSILDIYDKFDLEFPWMLNSKKILKYARNGMVVVNK